MNVIIKEKNVYVYLFYGDFSEQWTSFYFRI